LRILILLYRPQQQWTPRPLVSPLALNPATAAMNCPIMRWSGGRKDWLALVTSNTPQKAEEKGGMLSRADSGWAKAAANLPNLRSDGAANPQ
jgi:hypothetical protein